MGPSRLIDIEYKAKVDGETFKAIFNFLVGQNFVKRITKDQPVFAVTQRGINVLKYFRVLVQEVSDVEEI
jgi:predicted transcriptional regulator